MSRLRSQWFIEDEKLLQSVLGYLFDAGIAVDRGKVIALAGFKVEYSKEQKALKERIASMYKDAGIEMIKTDEILALDKDKGIVSAMLEELSSEGKIVKVNPSYYISEEGWEKALSTARSFDSAFTLAEYRDRLGTSRKYASELLPAFDRAGITIFDGNTRTVVKK